MADDVTAAQQKRFADRTVDCPVLFLRLASLADYFSVISTVLEGGGTYWFRGQSNYIWDLVPSALRFTKEGQRNTALQLLSEFMRVAEIKLRRPPQPHERLKWLQLGQHYGLPTRLLDWTESAVAGLYFACQEPLEDGLLFILNPIDLNRMSYPAKARIFDAQSEVSIIGEYLRLGGRHRRKGRRTIAINPVWNSERLMIQRGVFTLHGPRFSLDRHQAPSLVALPVLREDKPTLRSQLDSIGIDEMSLFPELDHACSHLKRKARLEDI